MMSVVDNSIFNLECIVLKTWNLFRRVIGFTYFSCKLLVHTNVSRFLNFSRFKLGYRVSKLEVSSFLGIDIGIKLENWFSFLIDLKFELRCCPI